MRKIIVFILSIFIFIFSVKDIYAVYDPLSVPNNKFGIHVQSENDFLDAANLVNSTGGDWGYVTFVIAENEKDTKRWQNAFDLARRLHLIPIVRIATKAEGENWKKPDVAEIPNWITFLNSLNWVIQNRYVIIGNEPNHAKEWGGQINPGEYGNYLYEFSKSLKEKNSDYFILPAGLDLAANNSKETMDAYFFYQKMFRGNPNVYDYIDGLASHSYPNPNFSGSEKDTGKKSIQGYKWELSFLKSIGVKKDLPVFITETGWAIDDENKISQKLKYAFNYVWNDNRVVAVTPFILNYPLEPFDKFSWKKIDGTFKSFYEDIVNISKINGSPVQIVKARILGVFVSPIHLVNSSFSGVVLAQNLGQSIWATSDISLIDESKTIEINTQDFSNVEPYKYIFITFDSKVSESGNYKIPFNLEYKGRNIADTYPIEFMVFDTLPKTEVIEENPSDNQSLVISQLNGKIRVYLKKIKEFLGPIAQW